MKIRALLVVAVALVGCGGSTGPVAVTESLAPSATGSPDGASESPDATESPVAEVTSNPITESGIRYTCGQTPFDPDVLDVPGSEETGDDPPAAALRELLESGGGEAIYLPPTGWTVVGGTPGLVEFVAPRGTDAYAFVLVESEGASWRVTGWGGCHPTAVLDGVSLATWTYAEDEFRPAPDTTTFDAGVTERACTGGQAMGDRLLPPDIFYGEAEITIIFAARPLKGGHRCPGNPSSRVTVTLREPLGDRVLRDGAFFPASDPAVIED